MNFEYDICSCPKCKRRAKKISTESWFQIHCENCGFFIWNITKVNFKENKNEKY